MRRLVAGLALLSACATPLQQSATPPTPTAPPPAEPVATVRPSTLYVFEGVEVFGSKVPQEELLRLMTLPAPGTHLDMAKGELVPHLIESKKRLLEAHGFAFSRFSVTEWAETRTVRVTVDLVDKGDEWRMPFFPAPQGEHGDPEGLLAAWKDYQKRYWQLRQEGAISGLPGRSQCRALVCHGGFEHPELAPLEQRFADGVPRNVDALVRVLREDKDFLKRMNVLMVLPYLPSREELIRLVLPSVRDPFEGVRNEALRILGMVQEGQPRVLIPLDTVLEALWYPLGPDRNKAGWALVRIVETEGAVHRQRILEKAGDVLVRMAGMKERIDHEPARKVLTVLAGQDFGDDTAAWRRWLEATRTAWNPSIPPASRPASWPRGEQHR